MVKNREKNDAEIVVDYGAKQTVLSAIKAAVVMFMVLSVLWIENSTYMIWASVGLFVLWGFLTIFYSTSLIEKKGTEILKKALVSWSIAFFITFLVVALLFNFDWSGLSNGSLNLLGWEEFLEQFQAIMIITIPISIAFAEYYALRQTKKVGAPSAPSKPEPKQKDQRSTMQKIKEPFSKGAKKNDPIPKGNLLSSPSDASLESEKKYTIGFLIGFVGIYIVAAGLIEGNLMYLIALIGLIPLILMFAFDLKKYNELKEYKNKNKENMEAFAKHYKINKILIPIIVGIVIYVIMVLVFIVFGWVPTSWSDFIGEESKGTLMFLCGAVSIMAMVITQVISDKDVFRAFFVKIGVIKEKKDRTQTAIEKYEINHQYQSAQMLFLIITLVFGYVLIRSFSLLDIEDTIADLTIHIISILASIGLLFFSFSGMQYYYYLMKARKGELKEGDYTIITKLGVLFAVVMALLIGLDYSTSAIVFLLVMLFVLIYVLQVLERHFVYEKADGNDQNLNWIRIISASIPLIIAILLLVNIESDYFGEGNLVMTITSISTIVVCLGAVIAYLIKKEFNVMIVGAYLLGIAIYWIFAFELDTMQYYLSISWIIIGAYLFGLGLLDILKNKGKIGEKRDADPKTLLNKIMTIVLILLPLGIGFIALLTIENLDLTSTIVVWIIIVLPIVATLYYLLGDKLKGIVKTKKDGSLEVKQILSIVFIYIPISLLLQFYEISGTILLYVAILVSAMVIIIVLKGAMKQNKSTNVAEIKADSQFEILGKKGKHVFDAKNLMIIKPDSCDPNFEVKKKRKSNSYKFK